MTVLSDELTVKVEALLFAKMSVPLTSQRNVTPQKA